MDFGSAGEERERERMRSWILAGRSDEDIALALMISVKLVRLVRRDVEAEVRPG
ncbi:MAG: hypothetical protein WCQ48_02345 [Chloroflexota bacterium]